MHYYSVIDTVGFYIFIYIITIITRYIYIQ